MFERIYNWKNKKKGFTLVELIVVLVILAILLAILVPSMTQWINKAKEKQILVNARTVYLAAQTVASEAYAKSDYASKYAALNTATKAAVEVTYEDSVVTVTGYTPADTDTYVETYKYDIAKLANLTVSSYKFTCTVDANGSVTEFTYNDGTNTAALTAGSNEMTVTKNSQSK